MMSNPMQEELAPTIRIWWIIVRKKNGFRIPTIRIWWIISRKKKQLRISGYDEKSQGRGTNSGCQDVMNELKEEESILTIKIWWIIPSKNNLTNFILHSLTRSPVNRDASESLKPYNGYRDFSTCQQHTKHVNFKRNYIPKCKGSVLVQVEAAFLWSCVQLICAFLWGRRNGDGLLNPHRAFRPPGMVNTLAHCPLILSPCWKTKYRARVD